MKTLLIVACAWILCSCSSAPMMHTSYNGASFSSAPTSADDPRLQHPQFYMDDSSSMPWTHDAPLTNR